MLYAGRLHDDVLDFLRSIAGSLQRRSIRKLQTRINETLIFIGKEAGRNLLPKKSSCQAEH